MTGEVVVHTSGGVGRISLNRPDALNALTTEMCEHITGVLLNWVSDPAIELVLLDHLDGTRGFCSGGDLNRMRAAGRMGGIDPSGFLAAEYRLIDLISRYPKPFITIMDGIAMGGGAGLAVNARYRIATDRTMLASSETGLGLSPSAGATWFLSRLPGELGVWLALTGGRLKGSDVAALGLATHFCPASEVADLKAKILKSGVSALGQYEPRLPFSLKPFLSYMDQMFSGDCAADIVMRLGRGNDWAKSQATKIAAKSPTSTKIALRQLRTGGYLERLQDALRFEYRIIARLSHTREFYEGVRARVIDKDFLPHWRPSPVRAVTGDMIATYFTSLRTGDLHFIKE